MTKPKAKSKAKQEANLKANLLEFVNSPDIPQEDHEFYSKISNIIRLKIEPNKVKETMQALAKALDQQD